MQLIRTNKVREIASILINFTIASAARVKQINTKSLCIWDLNTSPNGQEFSSTNAFNCDNLLGQIVGFYLNPSSNITHRVFISVPPPPFLKFFFLKSSVHLLLFLTVIFSMNLSCLKCCFWIHSESLHCLRSCCACYNNSSVWSSVKFVSYWIF